MLDDSWQTRDKDVELSLPEDTPPSSLSGWLGRALFGKRFSRSIDDVAAKVADICDGPNNLKLIAIRRLLTAPRALFVRHFDASSCGLCEMALSFATLFPRLEAPRFGIQLVASPRHADTLVVVGPLTRVMIPALRDTVEAMPHCRIVLTGNCASGLPRCCAADLCVPWPDELEKLVAARVYGDPPSPRALLLALALLDAPATDVKRLADAKGVIRGWNGATLIELSKPDLLELLT